MLDDYQQVAASYAGWDRLGAEVDFVAEHLTGDSLSARLDGAEVVVAMRERTAFDADLLTRLPALRLLVTTGAANASIDVKAAAAQEITVCGTRSLPGPAAELTWALLLAVLRHVPLSDRELRAGRWQDDVLPGGDLAGKTLGLLGLGRLGARVARVGLAFEMEVLAWSQNLDPGHARSLGVEPAPSKDDLLTRSDLVSLHLRLSDRTRGIVGERELGLMKPTAVLVNTSRGPLVDEGALVAALRDGRIAAAGLDVYDEEPLPADHPLRGLDNVVLTPHTGYVTTDGYRLFYEDVVEDIAAWQSGTPLRVLDP